MIREYSENPNGHIRKNVGSQQDTKILAQRKPESALRRHKKGVAQTPSVLWVTLVKNKKEQNKEMYW